MTASIPVWDDAVGFDQHVANVSKYYANISKLEKYWVESKLLNSRFSGYFTLLHTMKEREISFVDYGPLISQIFQSEFDENESQNFSSPGLLYTYFNACDVVAELFQVFEDPETCFPFNRTLEIESTVPYEKKLITINLMLNFEKRCREYFSVVPSHLEDIFAYAKELGFDRETGNVVDLRVCHQTGPIKRLETATISICVFEGDKIILKEEKGSDVLTGLKVAGALPPKDVLRRFGNMSRPECPNPTRSDYNIFKDCLSEHLHLFNNYSYQLNKTRNEIFNSRELFTLATADPKDSVRQMIPVLQTMIKSVADLTKDKEEYKVHMKSTTKQFRKQDKRITNNKRGITELEKVMRHVLREHVDLKQDVRKLQRNQTDVLREHVELKADVSDCRRSQRHQKNINLNLHERLGNLEADSTKRKREAESSFSSRWFGRNGRKRMKG